MITEQEAKELLILLTTVNRFEPSKLNETFEEIFKEFRQDCISRTRLIEQLHHLDKFNNNDCPEWVYKVIEGM